SSLASFSMRCGAFLFDYILTLLIPALTLVVSGYIKRRWQSPDASNVILVIGYLLTAGLIFVNFVYSYVVDGRSFGKRVIGLRVVRLNGAPMDYQTAFLRQIVGYSVSFIFFGIGMLWSLWDAKQQGWHDKLAQTIVVRD